MPSNIEYLLKVRPLVKDKSPLQPNMPFIFNSKYTFPRKVSRLSKHKSQAILPQNKPLSSTKTPKGLEKFSLLKKKKVRTQERSSLDRKIETYTFF